jgi:hypothetical protein
MKKEFYSDYERIVRVWDIEEVKDLMSRRMVYNANGQRRQELDRLWVSKPQYRKTASLGTNWGYYVGMDEIAKFYVGEFEARQQASLDAYAAAHPEIANNPTNLGYGSMTNHHVSTPCVVLADDGMTAKGTWYSMGVECEGKPDGDSTCTWYYIKVCADFVKEEDGQWKIWHLFLSNDVEYEAGTSLGNVPTHPAPGTTLPEQKFGTPTKPYLAHDRGYGWLDAYPTLPEPYFTYDPADGYGYEGRPQWPKGHPNYRKEDAE